MTNDGALTKRSEVSFVLAFCAVAIPLVGFAQQTPVPANASAQETAMRRAEIQKVEGLLGKIADRDAALFFLARRYAQVGDLNKALSLLKECVR
jgi:hypothetical protein